ncbi:MAG: hypothetical protein EZS28_034844 [Streblomastix strix]|uniref:Uncharacterized protein n=1 Tax=Streblomastix strix TaxID=222440 RepID=A0A5J4UI29_9EUKA|nr:MAG: hypothetical protein EZS28_034844 [Streblomastix strix]
MIMTTIMDKIKSETTKTINYIWEEAGKEGEQFELKVQVMDRIMMIGLKIYIARLKNNNQNNSGPFAINENMTYLQFKQLQERQFICQIYEQLKKMLFTEYTIYLPTSVKKAMFLGQVLNQLIKKQRFQLQTFEQPNNYSQRKIIRNN